MKTKNPKQNCINHISVLIDMSASMQGKEEKVVEIVTNLVKHLASRSTTLNQETRITVYIFNDEVVCLFYDKDVLRMPSIKDYYKPNGRTALVDATLKSLDDLVLTPEIYGDHSFLLYVLTDGQENASKALGLDNYFARAYQNYGLMNTGIEKVKNRITELPEHWTVAVLVPGQREKAEAKKFGFPADNIAIWDVTSIDGIEEGGETIISSVDTYMTNRSMGIRGTKSLFVGNDLNKVKIKEANLKPVPTSDYVVLKVEKDSSIRDFVENAGYNYKSGMAFYQLTKPEDVQPQKKVAVRYKKNAETSRFHAGRNARDLLGLPDEKVRVRPADNATYDIFVQSTSTNRKLIAGTELLLFPDWPNVVM